MTAKNKILKTGDSVSWQTSQGKTTGHVIGKLTAPAAIKGHAAKASAGDPQYKVVSSKSGKPAIHKAAALTKTG